MREVVKMPHHLLILTHAPHLGQNKDEVVVQTQNRTDPSPAGGLTPTPVFLHCHQAANVVIATI